MKFKIRGIRRINMPATRATIGCSSAAFRVKVIGLAPCSREGSKSRQGGPAAATRSGPRYQDNPEYPADAITTAPAIVAAAVIPEAASKQEDQQDDDQNQFHNGFSASAASGSAGGDKRSQPLE